MQIEVSYPILTQADFNGKSRSHSVETAVAEARAFRLQFPKFLDNLGNNFPLHVDISGIDLSIVDRRLMWGDNALPFGCPLVASEKIFLLDRTGLVVTLEKIHFRNTLKKLFFGSRYKVRKRIIHQVSGIVYGPRRIEDVLVDLEEKAHSVYFMLSWWSHTCAAILYIPPADTTIVDWIRELRRQRIDSFSTIL